MRRMLESVNDVLHGLAGQDLAAVDYMGDTLVKQGTIDAGDVARLYLTDSPDAVLAHLRDTAIRKLGLTYEPRARRRWYLWE